MHVMIIPDGDRRYAQKKAISNDEAYLKAAIIVRNLVMWVLLRPEVDEFTFFGLSYSNIIKRSEKDLDPILKVQAETLNSFSEDNLFHDNGINVTIAGQKHLLPKYYLKSILNVESSTKNYSNKKFNLLLGYSGKLDFESAIRTTLAKTDNITYKKIIENCSVKTPIDFLVRTANENRISDGPFFLTGYTEFYSIKSFFPELGKVDIDAAMKAYNLRNRTFGI